MRDLLRLEEILLYLFSIHLFIGLDLSWWWYPALLLSPDIGMLGYAAGPGIGAWCYNILHHRGVALLTIMAGAAAVIPALQLAGVVMLGHACMDRVFGFGLKHLDSFQHTHLGWIGRS